MSLSARSRDDADASLQPPRSPATASAMHRGSMIQLREARSPALSPPAAAAMRSVSPVAGQPASPAFSATVASSPSSRALPLSSRTPPKAGLGLAAVRESTLLLIWRFVVNLKRRVASLVKSLHAKSAHIRSLLLARFPQLSRVPPMLLGQLCLKSQKKLFQRKYTLVQQGQISEWIYIVQMGSLAVYQQSEHVISSAGGSTAGVGGQNEMNAYGSDASVAAASAAAGKRFEALHLADINAGDEVGIYGLLRPPTIVLVGAAAAKAGRRRKKKPASAQKKPSVPGAKGAKAALDSSSDSDDATASRKKGHTGSGSSLGDDWRGGYPQPHTVIASQPSIVYALSARLLREVLLSVYGLYEEVRTELTDKYLLRLKRFELWEIGRMRMQKIKQIQQTLVEAATKGKAGTIGGGRSGGAVDAAAVRASFEQAEAIVARDSIADLFHGQKKMFQTMSALSGVREIHALHSGGESSEGESDEEIGRGAFQIAGALPTDEGEVLLSQWNEKQTGALDKAHGSLSLDAPHHPPPNYKHVSILAQIHADKAGPPIPFVDTRRLVGSRRVYDLHANAGGAPTRHLITPSAKPSVSALALRAQGTEAQQQLAVRAIQHSQGHSLPPLTDATSLALLAHSGTQSHPSLGLSLAAVDAASGSSASTAGALSGELDASGGFVAADGSYISAEELTYQKRLAKLQAKSDRKAALKRTAEEEKFLEDILLVSRQVQDLNVTSNKLRRIEASKAAAEMAKERSGQTQQPASPSAAALSSSGRIAALGQRRLGALTVSTSSSQQLPSPTAAASAAASAARSPIQASSRSMHASASSPALQLVVPASSSAAIAAPTPVSSRVLGLGKSSSASSLSVATDPAKSTKQRNSFVNHPVDDFEPMLSPAQALPPTHERRTSSASAAGMLPGSPALGAMSPSGTGGFGGITLPAENPLYEHLPTLPSPQLRGLFALLKEHGGAGGAGGNAALYLLDTLAATKQLAALPTLPSESAMAGADDPSSPAHAKKKDLSLSRHGDHLHKRGSVLLDVGSPLQKLRRASISNAAAHAASSASNSATASPQLGATSSPLLDSMSPTHSGSLLAPSRHQRHTSADGQGGGISDPSISVPAGYHSASFHTFSEEAWKGVTRCSTPPLLPPAIEDPRVALIRQGIERAQFRVKARGHQTSVGIKEFSRDLNNANKKRPHILPVNAVEAQRKEKSLAAAAAAEADAGASLQAHAASASGSSGSSASTVIGPLVHTDNPLSDLRQSRVSVLHLFSMHKAKDRDYRALSEARAQAKVKAEMKAARKAAVHAAELKKAARIERRRARLVDPGLDAPDLLAPGHASSSSSSDDEDDDGDEGDDEVAGTLAQPGSPKRKPAPKSEESKQQQQFSPSQLLPQLGGSKGSGDLDSLLRNRHDTFLSPHHQRATHGSHALLLLEEQEVQRARARREHAQRLQLLQANKLKPAPGVDAETLRAQIKNEQQLSESESKQQQQPDHRSSSPTVVRSLLRRPLGKSTSLPAFHDDATGAARSSSALIAVHPSSLSSMLAASRTTKDQLVSALPSAANAFDLADGTEGGKPQPDYWDQRVIEALTMPQHKLCLSDHFSSNPKNGAQTSAAASSSSVTSSAPSSTAIGDSIATSLASMLSPFRLGSDWSAGRGIVIPNYDEGPGGSDLLAAIQRAAVDRSRKRIQADANQAEIGQTGGAVATPLTQNRDQPAAGRKDPRGGHRRTDSSTPESLALQGAMPPSRHCAHHTYTPPGVFLSDRGGPPLAMLTRLKTPQGRAETPPQTRPQHVQLKALPLHLVQ